MDAGLVRLPPGPERNWGRSGKERPAFEVAIGRFQGSNQPVEALESGGEQLTALARRLGYEGDDAAARLLADYQCQREAIRACYTRWFAREKGEEQ